MINYSAYFYAKKKELVGVLFFELILNSLLPEKRRFKRIFERWQHYLCSLGLA